jgi:hypothetical protein
MSDTAHYEKKIQLVLPKFEEPDIEEDYITKGKVKDTLKGLFSVDMEDLSGWFDKYNVESIELWVSGVIETGTILKLAISAKGEGGIKLILKPKQTEQSVSK